MNTEKLKERMKKLLEIVTILTITYLYGIISGIVFQLMKLFKIVRVVHWERFPKWRGNVILVANHPSIVDPFLLSALFFRQYVIRPFKYSPINVSDKKIFCDHWYFFWLRPLLVPVDRRSKGAGLKTLFLIKNLLDCGKTIIIFPEGSRTFRAKDFLHSKAGKEIGIFKDGVGWLATKTGAIIVPVWIDGSHRVFPNRSDRYFPEINLSERLSIRIGKPLTFQRYRKATAVNREQVTQKIVSSLLKLADEEE